MDIRISNADSRPIYEQVCQQIKQAILSGALREGDALPSIRALAKDLRISVITTRRAYEELERDGDGYDVDALVPYDKRCAVAALNALCAELRTGGESVVARKDIPEKLRYRRLVRAGGGEENG